MWPFRSKTKRHEKEVNAISARAIEFCRQEWVMYYKPMALQPNLDLPSVANEFSLSMMERLREKFPVLERTGKAVLVFFIIMGIVRSGTHRKAYVESTLNLKLS